MGYPPPREVLVKGLVFTSRRGFAESAFGRGSWKKVLAALPATERQVLQKPVTASSFFPMALSVSVDEAMVRVLAGGDTGQYRRMGAYSADQHVPTTYAGPIRSKDPLRFFKNAAIQAPRYYDQASIEVEVPSPNEGRIILIGVRSNAPNCETNLGFFARGLELCGAREVRADEPTCTRNDAQVCTYHFRWMPPV